VRLLAAHLTGTFAMNTQYATATSLDGFIATADHSLEWLFPFADVKDT
jgi:hypothetical protein